MPRRLSYPLLCTGLGLVLGWLPMLVHGPIPYKFDVFGIRGATAVWGWYVARLLVGPPARVAPWPVVGERSRRLDLAHR